MKSKENIPINSYSTFKYVKQQLEQELLKNEENLKGKLVEKIPFGLGNVLLNSKNNEGGLKSMLGKEAINSSIPIMKKVIFSLLKNHKKRMLVWGASAAGGLLISFLINKKLK